MSTAILEGLLVDTDCDLSLEDLCHATQSEPAFIHALIDYDIIIANGRDTHLRFCAHALKRTRMAVSFQRDLHVNLSGIHLALELLDQIEQLKNPTAAR
jgi:chaperone modulatory protein CbpM